MSFRLQYSSNREDFDPQSRRGRGVWSRAAMTLSHIALGGAVFGGIGVGIGLLLTPAFGYLSVPVVMLLLVCLAHIVRALRRRRGAVVLSYVEQAIRLNFPLPRMLYAARASERHATRKRLGELVEAVEAGAPVGQALAMTVPELPERTIQLTRTAERLGRLPLTLRRLVNEQRRPMRDPSPRIYNVSYPLLLIVAMLALASFIMIFVIPRFEQLLRDFKVGLPRSTALLIAISREAGPKFLLPLCAAMLLIYAGRRLTEVYRMPLNRRWGLERVIDAITWRVPIAHALQRDRGLADAFEVLTDALQVGFPLDRALIEVSELRMNGVLRRRLVRWMREVSGGMAIHEAARTAKMPAMVVGMLSSARGTAGLAEAAGFLARYYRGRFGRLATLLREGLSPMMAILFGVLVAWIGLAVFMPILRIMDRLSMGGGWKY